MQGILLLNTVLTVEAGKSNSHRNLGWEKLTDFIIEKLGKDPRPMVFLLWGNPSHKKEKLILNDNKFIIKTAHPSPLSAYRGFYGSKPFSKTNNFLEKNNLSPIIWA